jgi:CRISPR system Cascade subunit CasC
MLLELHLLQNFAPSCLNRDDTNAPKDCEFGGYRRARISSQCVKRAIRRQFREDRLLAPEHLARRTKRLIEALAERVAKEGRNGEAARAVVETAVKGAGLGVKEDGKTEYLLFLGEQELDAFARLVLTHYEALAEAAAGQRAEAEKAQQAEGKRKSGKDRKKEAREAIPADVKKAAQALLNGGKAADLALFGRMLADMPEKNIDAACQVAHALSTNRANMEMDYYTAVDDLKPDDTQGADMIGTVEFNSSCFYRYANIDLGQLRRNLQGDAELTARAVEAFVRAAVTAIPTGKQNSMAAHNPPDCILAVVREHGLWSLANAFVEPVRPTREAGIMRRSVEALDRYWGKLVTVYGADGISGSSICLTEDVPLANLADSRVASFAELLARVRQQLAGPVVVEARS